MSGKEWETKRHAVAGLHLDPKNPRLGRETEARTPRDIIQYLFEHDDAIEIAESIATRGYFPNEPLLAVKEGGRLVVIEGNRRLAALKALREPGLLEGSYGRQAERASRRLATSTSIAEVPVTVAPTRKATDRQIVGRHIGTPVRAWRSENRASFILDKLSEGYDDDSLRDELGFTQSDIQAARQTRAIAEMARSLDLPEEIKAKLDSPRAKVFTTLERVFDSTVGREYLHVEPDAAHGLRGKTSKAEFLRGFTKLVTDVALGKQSSRTLNTGDNIRTYFESWDASERPTQKAGSFVPSDVTRASTGASGRTATQGASTVKKSKAKLATVLPRDFKVRFGNERLVDIAQELKRMKRATFPNAGAVLLRVFLELSIVDYLERSAQLTPLIERLEAKTGGKLPYGMPSMKQLASEVARIAKDQLPSQAATRVEKALKYDASAPFTISDLHAFVHSSDLPGERDILQFWLRTEPLFRLMLGTDITVSTP